MAWYEIEYACGHTERKQLYGKITGRESYIEYCKEHRVCGECYKVQQKALEEEENQETEAKYSLPALVGTEKQIKWARSCRRDLVNRITARLEKAIAGIDPAKEGNAKLLEDAQAMQNYFRIGLSVLTEARYWIEHKDIDIDAMFRRIAKAGKNKEGAAK